MPKNKKSHFEIIDKRKELMSFVDFDFTHLEENFYNVRKVSFLERKKLEERLSSGYIKYDLISSEEEYREKALRFLTRTAYGLFELITTENVPNFRFKENSCMSCCGLFQNFIEIGFGIITQQNIPRQQKVDVLNAIVYHEQLHKRYTVKEIKKKIFLKKTEEYYENAKAKEYCEKLFQTKFEGVINNILEDRRIERLGAEEFGGISFYLEESRKYAAFLHAEKKFFPEQSSAIALDYLLIKILLPELEETFFEQISLYEKGLDEIEKEVSKVTADSFREELTLIKSLIEKIKNHIEVNAKEIFSDFWEDILKQTTEIYNLFPKNLKEEIENLFQKQIIIYINAQNKFGSENLNEGKRIELSEEEASDLQNIISDELEKIEKEFDNSKKTKNFEKIEEQKIISKDKNNNKFKIVQLIEEPIKSIDDALYKEAKKASKNIFNNLGFLDSKFNRFIENYELTEGDLDEDELYSIGFGNRHLFEEIEDIPGYSLDFGLLLDESGSMGGRIREAKLAVLSMLFGLMGNKHINLFVYGHTANDDDRSDVFQIYKYYNSLEKFTDWRRLFSAKARSNNADGYAIEKVAEFMKKSKAKDKILCVVSDGQPQASGYGGESAQQHVRSVVQTLENEGILVIQVCMAYIENSPLMFKHFVPYEKNGQFFDNLKKILLNKLQQFASEI